MDTCEGVRTCEGCRFFDPVKGGKEVVSGTATYSSRSWPDHGRCRKDPPITSMDDNQWGRWPRVDRFDWCGEWTDWHAGTRLDAADHEGGGDG